MSAREVRPVPSEFITSITFGMEAETDEFVEVNDWINQPTKNQQSNLMNISIPVG